MAARIAAAMAARTAAAAATRRPPSADQLNPNSGIWGWISRTWRAAAAQHLQIRNTARMQGYFAFAEKRHGIPQ